MRILAIETSGRECSIAALEGQASAAQLLNQVLIAGHQRTAQLLAPAIAQLLTEVAWPASSLQLVAVTVGPGSFTGLRIGVTTAKTLAYAVGAEVIGVNTLAVLAEQAPSANRPLWAVVDAQRQELFAARFTGDSPHFSPPARATPTSADREMGTVPLVTGSVPSDILPVADWLAQLRPGDRVTGPTLAKLRARLPDGIEVVDSSLWQPKASTVGQLAWRAYTAGHRDDLWQLAPHYYRPSAAEEKRARNEP
jgi:tRNA threonylcarbamoyladenosine biosynthesis protein TsaB